MRVGARDAALACTSLPAREIGRARVAEVMNRKRSLSIDMIRRLHRELGISAEVLIRPARENAAA